MLKQYLAEKNITPSLLAGMTGIPYSTLNDVCNGKTDINGMSFGNVKTIASALQISIEKLDELCCLSKPYKGGTIIVKNKSYYFLYQGEEVRLFKVNRQNSNYVAFAVECYLDEKKKTREMEKAWNDYITSCEETKS